MGTTGEYGLAILDMHMPLYEGAVVLKMLRRRHVLHPMKIIALTGDATYQVREALEAGHVDGFMLKPVELKVLLKKVQGLVGSAQ